MELTTIQIAGKEYPLSFSLGAAQKIISRYGSTEKMIEMLKKEGEEEKKINEIVNILELLMSQGCAYKNYFEKDMPVPENAPVEEGKWIPLPAEAIKIALMIQDAEEIAKKIEECINRGSKKKIEAKEIKTGKNARTTQE